MFKRLATFSICLLLLSILATAFHHHDDGADHPECSICLAHHQQSETGNTSPVRLIQRHVTETAYARPVPADVSKFCFSPANSRWS